MLKRSQIAIPSSIRSLINKRLYTTLFVILCFAVNCIAQDEDSYFPVKANARWDYIGKISSPNKSDVKISATLRFEEETLIDGKRYLKNNWTLSSPGGEFAPEGSYYRSDKNGIYKLSNNNIEKGEYLEIPFPIPIGISWLVLEPGRKPTTVRSERVSTIEVNGRKYKNCIKLIYILPDKIRVIETYLASGIGVVKVIYKNSSTLMTTELLLQKYEL